MKLNLILLAVLFLSASAIASENPITEKRVNASASTLSWRATKVVGAHEGTINIKSGVLKFDGNALTGGSFIIDMNTINVTDLSGTMKDKLQGHLYSDDFFSVENHKEASFVITKVALLKGSEYSITGDLTIKGISNPITFNAEVMNGVAKSTLKVDRTKYDIKYGSGSFFTGLGDKAIDNEFSMNIELKF